MGGSCVLRARIPALFVPVQSGNWSTSWFPTGGCSSPRPASSAETKETSEGREAGGGVQGWAPGLNKA